MLKLRAFLLFQPANSRQMAILYTCPNLENTYTMTKIPEKISRFRLRGTEIKAIGKNFYLYNLDSRKHITR